MKAPVLLLHGALGAAEQFTALKALLEENLDLYTPDFSGHGRAPETAAPFSIALFAEQVLAYMDTHRLDKVSVFGYSMGGYVALYLAMHYPERIERVITLATKLHWDEATAQKEASMLDAAKIAAKVPQLAAALQARHIGKDWKLIASGTAGMLLEMGKKSPLAAEDFSKIKQPVILLLGDRDKMVGLEETTAVYKSLPAGRMGMLPGTPHPFEQVDVKLLATLIEHFL